MIKFYKYFYSAAGCCLLLIAGCATSPEISLRVRQDEIARTFDYKAEHEAIPAIIDKPADFDEYFAYAMRHNNQLRFAFAKWQAALERVPQARSLDDPTLTFEYFVDQMDTRYRIGVSQMIPGFGKLGLREKRAVAEAESAWHNFEAIRFDLYEMLSKAFHEYHYLARVTDVTNENQQLLKQVEQVIDARYRSGAVPFSALINVQIEQQRLTDRLADMHQRRHAQSAALAALLDLSLEEPLPWPDFSPTGSIMLDELVLVSILADLNPELKAAEAMVEAARYGETLAGYASRPDFMLGAGWMVMPGMDGRGDESDIGLMAGITLPLWRGRIRAGRREASALTRAAEEELATLYNRLRSELSMALYKFEDAERRIALYRDTLIPQAQQAFEVARQEYADGRSEFMTMINAQRTLLEFQLQYERAVVDREIALADVSCCVGDFDIKGDNK